MSTVIKDLGAVSAYAYAVEKGYTGTEAEFAELMADYADVGQRAEDAANSALESKTAAQTAATTATNKASEATTAAQTATTKAGEATTAAGTATTAKNDAVAAKTAAETAQGKAEDAQAAAESVAESIPSDYSQLSEDVSDLKEDLNNNNDILALGESITVGWNNAGNGYINSTGGVTSDQRYGYTDYIDIQKYDYLTYKRPGTTSSSAGAYMFFYDASKNVISGKSGVGSQAYIGYITDYDVVTIPKNAVYARFSLYNDSATYGFFELYGHSKINNIVTAEGYIINGCYDITSEFMVAQYTSRVIQPNNKRIVNKRLYEVKAGDKIVYKTGELLVTFGLYYGATNTLHSVQAYHSTGAMEKSFTIPTDGLLVITFKNAEETIMSLNDFNATVKLKTAYDDRFQYEYYGEKISLKGFNSAKVLTLDRTGGNPDDIAVYGDYLISGVANDILRIYSITSGTKVGELTITGGSHFNVLAFSNEKYDNGDMFPLLYAETEGQNGIYNVIRIIDLSTYEIVKKYRFDESIYGIAPQIYFDFQNNVAYGICIPLEGRLPMYDFYKFDLANETENGDGTFTPAVLYSGKCPSPRTRQGGAYHNNRLYLMTTNSQAPFAPKIIVYNTDTLNPEIVSVLPNLPFTNEGEGLAIGTEGDNVVMYVSNVSAVYRFTFN